MRAVCSWSGGKDAAYALYELQRTDTRVEELMTTVSAETGRSSMHGVRRELYERQASAVGLPVRFVELPSETSNEGYERTMSDVTEAYASRGIDRIVFADLLLEDVREYREERLSGTDLEGCWPLWGRDTAELAHAVLDAGFRATVVCVDGGLFDPSVAGRPFDEGFLADLPLTVDPCGENGEFHTFVHDGPMFDEPVGIERGETVTRDVGSGEFHYRDLLSTAG